MSTGPEDPQRPVTRAPQDSPATDAPTTPSPTEQGEGTPSSGRRTTVPPAEPGRDRPGGREAGPEAEPRSGGRTAGLWISLILGAIVLILLLIFIIQNNVPTRFEYFTAQFQLPLGVAMLLAAIAGALVMALVGSVRMVQMSWTIRRMRKQQEKIHRATG
ncbi:MAG TPA: DUF1049 domain-containing protein [Candidatus Brachybacterium merdavium]|uniref:DUF1049 domain-containing protein n=1 Tax=Candidatus Brachybacterium merdavium TaxID=2838513 RepID=A0A9D2RP13_9MICO|nr:DUF1049 domain-containing protein [Candidatus Brachybacterium merdavium]